MHIAFLQFAIHPTPDYRKIASELRYRGHKAWLGTPNEAGQLAWHDGERVVAVQRGPMRLPDKLLRTRILALILRRVISFCFIVRIRRFLRQSRPEIVQVNPASVLWFWVLPLLMPGQMAFVVDFRQIGQRDTTHFMGKLKNRLRNWRIKIYSRFIYHHACFLHRAGAMKILGNEWPKWGSVVPLGVDLSFLTSNYTVPASMGNDKLVRFLYLGGISKIRQLERILFASQWMLAVSDKFEIVFMGTDKSQGFYHSLVNKLGLSFTVKLKPPVRYEDVPEVVSIYDVALAYVPNQPADWRYHPTLKVLEYRALGMPIIATDNKPNAEVVVDGVNGLLVQNSVESLAEGMLHFVKKPEFLERCKANAIKMRQGKTWSEIAVMYEQKVYYPLLNNSFD